MEENEIAEPELELELRELVETTLRLECELEVAVNRKE